MPVGYGGSEPVPTGIEDQPVAAVLVETGTLVTTELYRVETEVIGVVTAELVVTGATGVDDDSMPQAVTVTVTVSPAKAGTTNARPARKVAAIEEQRIFAGVGVFLVYKK